VYYKTNINPNVTEIMMKHNLKVTYFLILLFFTAQVIGLYLLNQSIETIELTDAGIVVKYEEPITGRPELEGQESFTYILAMIFFGTLVLFMLIKFKLYRVWKVWFFLAIWGALLISFSVVIPELIAVLLALVLTILKLYKPNVIIHNLTEVFMYGGIAILISPLFNVFWAVMLLIVISIYDMIAVWKLKHMITLATAQADQKMFAGLLIPYTKSKILAKTPDIKHTVKSEVKLKIPKGFEEKEVKSAILGGGDIAFPLLFAGSIMTWLIQQGISRQLAFFQSLIISLFAGIALFLLLIKSKKDKFYPAMPFISLGCFVGLGIIYLLV